MKIEEDEDILELTEVFEDGKQAIEIDEDSIEIIDEYEEDMLLVEDPETIEEEPSIKTGEEDSAKEEIFQELELKDEEEELSLVIDEDEPLNEEIVEELEMRPEEDMLLVEDPETIEEEPSIKTGEEDSAKEEIFQELELKDEEEELSLVIDEDEPLNEEIVEELEMRPEEDMLLVEDPETIEEEPSIKTGEEDSAKEEIFQELELKDEEEELSLVIEKEENLNKEVIEKDKHQELELKLEEELSLEIEKEEHPKQEGPKKTRLKAEDEIEWVFEEETITNETTLVELPSFEYSEEPITPFETPQEGIQEDKAEKAVVLSTDTVEKIIDEISRGLIQNVGEKIAPDITKAIVRAMDGNIREVAKELFPPIAQKAVNEEIEKKSKELIQNVGEKIAPDITKAIVRAMDGNIREVAKELFPPIAQKAINEEIKKLKQ
ncbi:MAG: hypothetical protein SWO11_02465 [Thermodesulfobacteriota bacterium]|nr:hypothetical protein [Thermodesulfobacteriota bacterium]